MATTSHPRWTTNVHDPSLPGPLPRVGLSIEGSLLRGCSEKARGPMHRPCRHRHPGVSARPIQVVPRRNIEGEGISLEKPRD